METLGFFCRRYLDFFENEVIDPVIGLRSMQPLNQEEPSAFTGEKYKILSSSCGRVLCNVNVEEGNENISKAYHIFRPIPRSNNPYMIIPSPPRAHRDGNTSAVIYYSELNDSFRIIYVFHEGDGRYSFDFYSSKRGVWTVGCSLIQLDHNRRLELDMGISCAGNSYWLAECVLNYVNLSPYLVTHDPIETVEAATRTVLVTMREAMQLGTVYQNLCLVTLDAQNETHLFGYVDVDSQGNWPRSFLSSEESIIHTYGEGTTVEVTPLRFENDKVEILFAVDGRMMRMWERSRTRTRIGTVPIGSDKGIDIRHL